ncbi:MAG: hypothetical protein ABIB71_00530 [Candidatus Woesearchaeota archaeon]
MERKNIEEMLQKELCYCYGLLKETFSVDFLKPDLSITEKKDDGMTYMYESNSIGVPEHIAIYPSGFIGLSFLHELGHAFACQENQELQPDNLLSLMNSNLEKCITYCIFHEGLADYMAIRCCKKSDNKELRDEGAIEADKLWFKLNIEVKYTVPMFAKKKEKWQETVISMFPLYAARITDDRYLLGYHFFSNLKDKDVKRLVKSPPSTIGEIVYPQG